MSLRKRNHEEKWEKSQIRARDVHQNPNLPCGIREFSHRAGLHPYGDVFCVDKGQGWHSSIPSLFPKFPALSPPHINPDQQFQANPSLSLQISGNGAVQGPAAAGRADARFPLNSLQILAGSKPDPSSSSGADGEDELLRGKSLWQPRLLPRSVSIPADPSPAFPINGTTPDPSALGIPADSSPAFPISSRLLMDEAVGGSADGSGWAGMGWAVLAPFQRFSPHSCLSRGFPMLIWKETLPKKSGMAAGTGQERLPCLGTAPEPSASPNSSSDK